MGYTLKANMVDGSKYGIKCPHAMSAEYITVHNTSNDASAKNEIAYMIGNNNQVSFHYAIDDIEVIQGVPEDRNTWNAGDGNGNGNRKSIAIEICYSASGRTRFIEAEKNAAMFIAERLNDLGWGIDRVRTHKSWSGKNCPHRTLEMGWQRFLDMVTAYKTGGTPSEGAPVQPTPAPTPPAPLKDLGQVDAIYQVYTEKWWPEVRNWEDFAGKGDGVAIRYLALRVSKGSVKYRLHSIKNGWLGWVTQYNINDLNNGCAGDGTPADLVEIYYYTPDGYYFKRAVYRVSDMNHTTYYAEQHDSEKGNGQDGYGGLLGVAMDKLQIKID